MVATWNSLLSDVMILTESVEATDIEDVAKIYLFRTLKYISRTADLDGLISSASRAWQDTETSILIGGTNPTTGFGITDFQTPYLLMVGNSSTTETPVPYHPLAYKDWLVLKGASLDGRLGLNSVVADQRPSRVFTINYSAASTVELDPLPADNSTVTLYYFKLPTPFGDGSGTPPIVEDWNDLLVDGTVLLTRAYIENPGGEKIDVYKILKALDPAISQMQMNLEGKGFRRTQIRISPNYSPRNGRFIRGVSN